MKSDGLAKHYSRLTPAERLSLIMAASKRDDEEECQRLATSAPSVTYRAPHYFALASAFRELCESHRMKLLELAAMYLYGSASAQAVAQAGVASAAERGQAQRLLDVSRWFGYMLKVNLAGWRQFCAGQHLDPDPFMASLPGKEVLGMAAELAEQDAFTAEEALAYMRRQNMKATAATTAEDVAAGLRKDLDGRAAWWG
jgi:hypothetical protein